jgi:GntR family transcriptional regulator
VQIHLSRQNGVPTYLQIVNQVKYLVASGRLQEGEELPPIRVLAEQLLINPNTVARAYRELELAGIVAKRSTTGTYVSDAGSPLARRQRVKILTERIDALLIEARQLSIGTKEIIDLLHQRDAALQPHSPGD